MGHALEQFKKSLELAEALRNIERNSFLPNPRMEDQSAVKGLRGGAAVLLVAAFEFFIRKLFEDNISKLNTIPATIDLKKLPDKFQIKAVFHSLQRAMDGPMFEAKPPKLDRIESIFVASKLLLNDQINPQTFSETGSNPNGETVKEKFNEIGIQDIFGKIKPQFESKWDTPVSQNFIKDKLDEIVRTRHVVAHTADALNITRKSQNEAFKFLKILAELLEKEMEKHIKDLQRTAKKT